MDNINDPSPNSKFILDSNIWINATVFNNNSQLNKNCKQAIIQAQKEGIILRDKDTYNDLYGALVKLEKQHKLKPKGRYQILKYFEKNSVEVKNPQSLVDYAKSFDKYLLSCNDPQDWSFLSLAHQQKADYIVTNDLKHLRSMGDYFDTKIRKPDEFIQEMQFREQRNSEKKIENPPFPETDELLKELKAGFEEKYKDFWKKNQEGKLTDTDFREVYYAAASVIQREVIVSGVSREESLAKHKYEGKYVKNYEAKRELNSKAKAGHEFSTPVVEPAKKGPELPKDAGIVKPQNKTNDKDHGSGGGMSI